MVVVGWGGFGCHGTAPTELTGRSVRLDSVFELDEPSLVVQVEFERNARADRLHPRLVTYFERLLTRYGEAPEQYVVVLERSNGRLPGVYRVGGLRLRYHTVHLWDVDPDPCWLTRVLVRWQC